MVLTLKDFLLKTLSNYNCEADLDVLSDYIMALIESKDDPPVMELNEQLQVFLYESTEAFVKELINFLDSKEKEEEEKDDEEEVRAEDETDTKTASDSDSKSETDSKTYHVSASTTTTTFDSASVEDEVDYEEDEKSIETEILIKPQRLLREYSPERRSEPPPSKAQAQKQPCTNFSRYGNCRFGDNCRYSHVTLSSANQRRRSVSSRVKLSNLPPSIINTAAITEIMKSYGSVVSVTVYPEKGEATVQYVTGDEASSAVEGAINDFEGDNVVIELETLRQRGPVVNKPPTLPNKDDKLQSLISLQKQQQSLLETNLLSQQSLLIHLQSPSLSVEEKSELLGTLKRVQDSVMGLQEMLKRTTELVAETVRTSGMRSGSGTEKKSRSFERVGKNNFNTGHHNTEFNNTGYQSNYTRYHTNNNTGYHNSNYNLNQNSKFNQSSNSYSFNSAVPQNKFAKNSLDLRPTTLKLGPLNKTAYQDIRALQSRFSPYGMIQSLIVSDGGQTALIKYQKHGDAVKAQNATEKEFEGIEGVEFAFIKQE